MNKTDKFGRTELHYAASDGNVELVKSLIDAGMEAGLPDAQGWTPLHFAAQSGAVEVARLLIDAGVPIDPKDIHGNTPLFRAVFESRGSGEMITFLRSKGADPHSANKAGQTPVGLARLIANYDVKQFFKDVR